MKSEIKRKVLIGSIISFLFLLPIVTRGVWEGRKYWILGKKQYEKGEIEKAILYLRRSSHWYLPLSPYPRKSMELLKIIGNKALEEKNLEVAKLAFFSIRGSVLGTRSFYTPHKDMLEYANQKIATIFTMEEPSPEEKGLSIEKRYKNYLSQLENLYQPNPLYSFLASLFFILWIGTTIKGILSFKGEEKKKYILKWGGVSFGCLILWLIFLYLA